MTERNSLNTTMNKYRKALSPIALGLFVILMAIVVAIATVQRNKPGSVAPTAPESQPAAMEVSSQTCSVDFVVTDGSQVTGEPTPTTSQNPQADLSIIKTVNNQSPSISEIITYTLTARNLGPDTATNVVVTDQLPDGLEFISSDSAYDNSSGVWTIGSLTLNQTATLTITARVLTLNPIINVATIGSPDSDDTNTSNNTNNPADSVLNAGGSADLGLTKTVSNTSPRVGDTISYTINVNNAGPNAANNVQVTDKLDSGLTLLSYIASQGTYTASNGIWDIGTVAVDQQITLVLNVRVDVSARIENRATITRSSLPDPNTTNNTNNPSDATFNSTPASVSASNTPVPTATRTTPQLPKAGAANSRALLILGVILTVVILGAVGIILLL